MPKKVEITITQPTDCTWCWQPIAVGSTVTAWGQNVIGLGVVYESYHPECREALLCWGKCAKRLEGLTLSREMDTYVFPEGPQVRGRMYAVDAAVDRYDFERERRFWDYGVRLRALGRMAHRRRASITWTLAYTLGVWTLALASVVLEKSRVRRARLVRGRC